MEKPRTLSREKWRSMTPAVRRAYQKQPSANSSPQPECTLEDCLRCEVFLACAMGEED